MGQNEILQRLTSKVAKTPYKAGTVSISNMFHQFATKLIKFKSTLDVKSLKSDDWSKFFENFLIRWEFAAAPPGNNKNDNVFLQNLCLQVMSVFQRITSLHPADIIARMFPQQEKRRFTFYVWRSINIYSVIVTRRALDAWIWAARRWNRITPSTSVASWHDIMETSETFNYLIISVTKTNSNGC